MKWCDKNLFQNNNLSEGMEDRAYGEQGDNWQSVTAVRICDDGELT